ncbi:hypothetical protein L4D06_07505 [Enterovibrio makurazakiensis]|uniref:Uncharacterized protein n=1 Tax=Enterovibrio gelatinilyticus TaxID=2899819 RepID=A0ABT5QUL7_9GAMM|nr:hypothetical protein [Enterovibrio sp. ZSDZ42]MDD1791691.1 hypothetical protein [Enterovibrio sp. ZSDZ42]
MKASATEMKSGYYLFDSLSHYQDSDRESLGLDYQYELLQDQILYLDIEQRLLSVYQYTEKYDNHLEILKASEPIKQGFTVVSGNLFGSNIHINTKDDVPELLVIDDLVIGGIFGEQYRSYWRLVQPENEGLVKARDNQQQLHDDFMFHKESLVENINACLVDKFWGDGGYLQSLSTLADTSSPHTWSSFSVELPLQKIDIESQFSRVSSRSKYHFIDPLAIQRFFSRKNSDYLMAKATKSAGETNTRSIALSIDDVGIQIHELDAGKDSIDWAAWQRNVVASPIQVLYQDDHNLIYIGPYLDEIILTRRDYDPINKVHVFLGAGVDLTMGSQLEVCKRFSIFNSLRQAEPQFTVAELIALSDSDFNQRYGKNLVSTHYYDLITNYFLNADNNQKLQGMIQAPPSMFADLSYKVYSKGDVSALASHVEDILDFNSKYSPETIIVNEYQHSSGTINLLTIPSKGRTTLYFVIEYKGRSHVFEKYFYLNDYLTNIRVALLIKEILATDWQAILVDGSVDAQ